jgi:transposase InsO family protein
MNELLNELYYNPTSGFQGLDKLYKKAKAMDKKITKKFVKEWLDEQEKQQITQQEKKTKRIFNSIISPEVRNNFQADIMYLPHPTKNRFKYLLTCIDVYSRKVFAEPIKNKNTEHTLKAMQKILKKSGIPKNLNVDAGGEFDNKVFKEYADEQNITIWMSNPEQENKNSIIERFHRTLRNMLLKYEIATKKPYINDLQKLIKNYNDTEHSTIQTEPNKIWNDEKPNLQQITYVSYDFLVGDKVRHAVKLKQFDKASSTEKYTKQIYTITRIDKNSYYLADKANNELTKKFRGYELKLAVGNDIDNDDKQKQKNKIKEKLKKLQKELE